MKQLQRIAQGIVVFALCGVLLCGNAFADVANTPFPDIPAGADYAEAVTALADMGIFEGNNGNFYPNRTITRAEVAAVICRMLGVENEAKQMTNVVFSDVPATHWAVGYVAKAAELNIIGGYRGRFEPSDPVTYEQMIKMLVCAWGYEELAMEYQAVGDAWSSGYLRIAEDLGITQGIFASSSDAAPRWTVALLCYRLLDAPKYGGLWGDF